MMNGGSGDESGDSGGGVNGDVGKQCLVRVLHLVSGYFS